MAGSRLHPAIGAGLFVGGVALFVAGIPFEGIAFAMVGGVLFCVAAIERVRRRRYAAPEMARPVSFPSAPRAPRSRSAADPIEQLERLTALRDAGALSAAEFEAQKARLLSGP